MRRVALALFAAAVVAFVAALDFARAATDCAANQCVYVPLIRAQAGPGGAPDPTQFGPPQEPTKTPTNTPLRGGSYGRTA